jgi:hypothetical protein
VNIVVLFNSLEFMFIFLPVAVTLHFLTARWSVVSAVMMTTVTSLFFYAWWPPLCAVACGVNHLQFLPRENDARN